LNEEKDRKEKMTIDVGKLIFINRRKKNYGRNSKILKIIKINSFSYTRKS
jgi:hypothetical protein